MREVREAGARIKFISDGDVAGAVMACSEGTGVDLLLGIGGTPEGIITACAVKCLGGTIQAKLWPQKKSEFANAAAAGLDLDAVLSTDDLVRSDNVFFVATGITDGELRARRALPRRRRARPSRWSCAASPARSAGSPASTA